MIIMMVEYVYKTKEGEEEMNSKNCIKKFDAIQVYTRRHVLGIKAFVETEGGAKGQAECSAGVSIGSHEVHFEYDGGTRWGGKGCTKAVNSINTVINDTLRGMDVTNQYELDRAMLQIGGDGKNAVGGNAIAAVSAACLKAGAAALEIPLYRYIGGERACMLPVPGAPAYSGGERWGGGVHPTGNKPTTAFQCYDFGSFAEASYAGWEVYRIWEEEMFKRDIPETDAFFFKIQKGKFKDSDEGIFELMADCIRKAGYENKVGIQIDFAADTYYDRETKLYRGLLYEKPRDRDELMDYYIKIIRTYPFVSVEDPFYEDDYESHALLTSKVDIQVVGDDLYTTMRERVQKGVLLGATNAMLLKVNQVGSITEALEAARFAHESGLAVMPCESRGEDQDIADYCVGIGAESVREMAVLNKAANRFLEIEEELGGRAQFWGKKGLKGKKFQ